MRKNGAKIISTNGVCAISINRVNMPAADQNISPNRYQVVPRVLLFIFDGSKVLLIHGDSKKKIWAEKYNGVGGHVEPGEDILTAAKR
ncbi:MAG TPA: NUDIX domain-containing protein, partial [Anaerolineaceae bacterium]|nr:NUDIX domain-containing protein [Anaerolineaceae bacterium]